ncbi:MAG: DUF3798 domain-containing protein [Clostridiales bacterium]|nr:DUF3798 domain-containing protein [Clostridiales bacterium]
MKKFINTAVAVFLCICFLFSLSSCNFGGKTVKIPKKKVALLVAPESEYPDDFRAAQKLAGEFPDTIVIKEYSDSRILKEGNAQIIEISKKIAQDSSFGAIVYARGTQFCLDAIAAAKLINEDLLFYCIEPEDDIDTVATFSTAVVAVDWEKACEDIVKSAKSAGARSFVMFSFNRHTADNPLYASISGFIKSACEENHIIYKFVESKDPIYSSSLTECEVSVNEAVLSMISKKEIEGNRNVALFSTDVTVQKTLVEIAQTHNYIYVSPELPSAYSGIFSRYNLLDSTSDKAYSDVVKAVIDSVNGDSTSSGKLFVYDFDLIELFERTCIYSAFDVLCKPSKGEKIYKNLVKRADELFDKTEYSFKGDETYSNLIYLYSPAFSLIEKPESK